MVNPVSHTILLEVGVSLAVVVVAWAVGDEHRTKRTGPDVAARVANSVDDARFCDELLSYSCVALQHLATHGVADQHDVRHLGENLAVVEVADKFVEHIERRHVVRSVRVLVVRTSGPMRTAPYQGIRYRALT
jgi:hypothetical protein